MTCFWACFVLGFCKRFIVFGCFCVFSYAISFLCRPIDRASMKVVKDLEGSRGIWVCRKTPGV